MEEEKKYSLGLDLGTNSIGWAVVDEKNELVKKNGQHLWGVRMFEEAETAVARRAYRCARRRLVRRKNRLNILQNIFSKEIEKVDPHFYNRLNNSFFKIEDKDPVSASKYSLFDDEDFSDFEYMKKYPTIFHLRNQLLTSKEKVDIRLLYLALHHIIKYRGNFLNPGSPESFKLSNDEIASFLNELKENLDKFKESLYLDDDEDEKHASLFDFPEVEINNLLLNKIEEVLVNVKRITERKEGLWDVFGLKRNDKSFLGSIVIPLLSGSKINLASFTYLKDENIETTNLDVNAETFEEVQIEEALSKIPQLETLIATLKDAKKVVNYCYLKKILGTTHSISKAMIHQYEKHQKDLKELKRLVKTYLKESYNDLFRVLDSKTPNYPHYIGMNKVKDKIVRCSHSTRDDFYKFLKAKILNPIKEKLEEILKVKEEPKVKDDLTTINKIFDKIEANEYLLRQNNNLNGAIPMQLNAIELKEILNNQSRHYSFLDKTTCEAIYTLFSFKIPYFVGPLKKENNEHAWFIRKENDTKEGKITPLTYKDIVDEDASAIEFIKRMQRNCTYIRGEKCLPKDSLLYSEYNCLSFLNNLTLIDKDGEGEGESVLNSKIKNELIENVFKKYKKVTKKTLRNYLAINYKGKTLAFRKSKISIEDKDFPDISANMKAYVCFSEDIKIDLEDEDNVKVVEEIINDIVIFEDKSILERRLKERIINGHHLSDEQIKQIKGYNFDGYGRLSKKFLADSLITDKVTGEILSLLDVLRSDTLTVQEILYSNRYNYQDVINEINAKYDENRNNNNLMEYIDENIYVNPAMKRTFIQAYKIIEEVEKIIKKPIDYYYIECARAKGKSKKTPKSRYENLLEIYKNATSLASDYLKEQVNIEGLKEQLEEKKDSLKINDVYLYFLQLGKDLYTLKDIDLNDLTSGNSQYDHDHLYPRSKIKDDSLHNNLILTEKKINNDRQNKFLFEIDNFYNQRKENVRFYRFLASKGLMSKEKLYRLTQRELSPSDLEKFTNRQLVSTNQSTKSLVKLLIDYKKVKNTNIIWSKAENISDFRSKYNFIKSREANNFHHAHDAYLNVVVGRTIDKVYKKFAMINVMKNIKYETNFSMNPETIIERSDIKKGSEGFKTIEKTLYKCFDIMETIRTFEQNTILSQVTIVPASETGGPIPVTLKDARKDVTKYGGFKQPSYSHYALIEVTKKKKDKLNVEYRLIPIPGLFKNNINAYLSDKLKDEKSDVSFKIIKDHLHVNTVIEKDKRKFCLTGVTGGNYLIQNLKDRRFSRNAIETIHKIEKKYMPLTNDQKAKLTRFSNGEGIILAPAKDNKCKEIIVSFNELENLYQEIRTLYSKDIYNYLSITKNLELIYSSLNMLKEKYPAIKENVDKNEESEKKEDKKNEKHVEDTYFIDASIEIVMKLLGILKTNQRNLVNISKINGSTSFMLSNLNQTLTPGTKIIAESITGFYRKVLFEVPEVTPDGV